MALRRVYHPTLNTSYEVEDKDVEAWAELGWRKTKADHHDAEPDPEPVPEYVERVEDAPAEAEGAKAASKK